MHPLPSTHEEIAAFVSAFEAGTLPKERWTHAAHILSGAWYVHVLGPEAALTEMRRHIRAYNEAVGTQNTDSSGYHETITVFWIRMLEHFHCCWVSRKERAAAFSLRKTPIDVEALHYAYSENALAAELARSPEVTRAAFVTEAVEHFGPQRDILTRYYSFNVVKSTEARRTWIEPDLMAIGANE
ncbi:hypothetical protein [Terriglobus albidus]|uniref:hypothetical protein n=1 Tax=Terriglobus albidus TaxID=1592106 RepID=UPI0021DFCE0A|nr:hypothetical protein [Terriglobus albidus]